LQIAFGIKSAWNYGKAIKVKQNLRNNEDRTDALACWYADWVLPCSSALHITS